MNLAMALKAKVLADDGWMDQEGNFYSCFWNRDLNDRPMIAYATNLHAVLANQIVLEQYPGINPDDLRDEHGYSNVQGWLVGQGWIRVDIAHIWYKTLAEITDAQVATLRQMLTMSNVTRGFAREYTEEILADIEKLKKAGNDEQSTSETI